MKHEDDFVAKHNIQKGHLPSHLKNVVSKGKVINSSPVKLPNGKYGLEKSIFTKENTIH